jgi:hypothetical protein
MKQTATFSFRSIRTFAHKHDDLPAFHAAYLVLSFLAAALFNLGFFALIIFVHMMLDVFKYRDVHGLNWKQTIEGVIRESLIDFTLFLFGLVISVYLHPSLTGLAGIKGMMLAEITVLRGIGIMTPKLKILFEMLKVLSDIDRYMMRLHPKLGKNAGLIEYVCMFSVCITLGMLLIAPILLMLSSEQYLHILIDELTPWKL